jgi:hypothetical protein
MEQGRSAIATAFQAHLEVLAGELRGARRDDCLRQALDEAMRLQAVLAIDEESAIACLQALPVEAALVDTIRPLARERFVHHRQRIAAIRAGELSRAGYVARRRRAKMERRPTPDWTVR